MEVFKGIVVQSQILLQYDAIFQPALEQFCVLHTSKCTREGGVE